MENPRENLFYRFALVVQSIRLDFIQVLRIKYTPRNNHTVYWLISYVQVYTIYKVNSRSSVCAAGRRVWFTGTYFSSTIHFFVLPKIWSLFARVSLSSKLKKGSQCVTILYITPRRDKSVYGGGCKIVNSSVFTTNEYYCNRFTSFPARLIASNTIVIKSYGRSERVRTYITQVHLKSVAALNLKSAEFLSRLAYREHRNSPNHVHSRVCGFLLFENF